MTEQERASEPTPKRKLYRFGYRIHIKQEGEREAIELRSPMADGDPCTLAEVEAALKEVVEQGVDNFEDTEEMAPLIPPAQGREKGTAKELLKRALGDRATTIYLVDGTKTHAIIESTASEVIDQVFVSLDAERDRSLKEPESWEDTEGAETTTTEGAKP